MPARKGSKKLVLKQSFWDSFKIIRKLSEIWRRKSKNIKLIQQLDTTISDNQQKINELECKLKDKKKLVSDKTKHNEQLAKEI